MNEIRKKRKLTLKKHDVSFEEATEVFFDPLSLTVADPLHSDEESRFIITGFSVSGNQIVVVHTDRGDKIRIIQREIGNTE